MFNSPIPAYVAKKIYPTNVVIGALIFCLAIPFTIISIFLFDWLYVFPLAGGLSCAFAYWITKKYSSGIYLARFIVCLVPEILAATYNAYLSDAGGQPLPALYLCELAFAMLPFVVYDLDEWVSTSVNFVVCAIIIITFEFQNILLVSDISSDPIRGGWLMQLTTLLAIMAASGSILGLAIMNRNETRANEKAQLEINNGITKQEEIAQENEMKLRRMEAIYEKQTWVKNIESKLTAIVSNGSQVLLSELCKYFNTERAVMYDRVGDTLRKSASYAMIDVYWSLHINEIPLYRKVFTDKQQCVVSVPAGFTTVDSAYCIITPVVDLSGRITGIIEVAILSKPTETELEVLQKTATLVSNYAKIAVS